eukprot:12918297-Prorocentrum_lima.AAC.1
MASCAALLGELGGLAQQDTPDVGCKNLGRFQAQETAFSTPTTRAPFSPIVEVELGPCPNMPSLPLFPALANAT